MQRLIEQVAGILHRNGVEFDTRADGTQYRILLDSSATFVSFSDFGGRTVVSLYSPILQEIDDDGGRENILEALNDRNAASRFGRFVYYPELRVIALEYDLLGDDLQEAELMNAIGLVSETANAQDEELKLVLGTGMSYQEAEPGD
jgi:type III secretion system-like peptide-binding chaperone